MNKEQFENLCTQLHYSNELQLNALLDNLKDTAFKEVVEQLQYKLTTKKLQRGALENNDRLESTIDVTEWYINGDLFEVVNKKTAIENELNLIGYQNESEVHNFLMDICLSKSTSNIGAYRYYAEDVYIKKID